MEEQEEKMTKIQIVEALQNLVNSDDFLGKRNLISDWKTQFYAWSDEEQKNQRAEFDGRENKDEDERFEFVANDLDIKFKELLAAHSEKVKGHKDKIAEEEKQNFNIKDGLVKELKTLVEENMQNVGAAFNVFNAIQEKWNTTGAVNKSKFKQLQFDYSHYRDLFYYHVGIHHELKNYDLKKNAEQKQDIVAQLKTVVEQDSIKLMEKTVKELQAKWDQIGPTSNDIWENLKNEYWDAVNVIYDKIKIHYKALRETQEKILGEKSAIVASISELKTAVEDFKTPKDWASLNEQVNTLHQKWKEAGFLGKGKEDEIWNQFKSISDELRNQKNAFFDDLKKSNNTVLDAKTKLIEKAESLKESTEWKVASEHLIKLQKEWKNIGQGQYKADQELWEKFRAACDTFFNAKNEYFSTLDQRQEANLTAKNEIAGKIAKTKTEAELKALIQAWQAVAYVPKNKISESENTLNSAIKDAAKIIGLDTDALSNLKFEAKVSAMKNDANADSKIKAEKQYIQTQIDTIKEELHRFDENMAFFGQSKGAQKLKEAFEKRIKESESKLSEWMDKLKTLQKM